MLTDQGQFLFGMAVGLILGAPIGVFVAAMLFATRKENHEHRL